VSNTYRNAIDKLVSSIQLEILDRLSRFVRTEFIYIPEKPGIENDVWKRLETIKDSERGVDELDCDEYAIAMYDLAVKTFGFSQDDIRLGIFHFESGGGHIAVLYYGDGDRSNPWVISSTGQILRRINSDLYRVRLKEVYPLTRWWLDTSFNDKGTWGHEKPTVNT